MTTSGLARIRARPRPKPRTVLIALALLGLLFVIGALASTPQQAEQGAMERFLAEMDVRITQASAPSDPNDVAILPSDQRVDEELDDLLAWVRSGGRLIVTDPDSNLLRELNIDVASDGGLFGDVTTPTDCLLPETAAVATVVTHSTDRRLQLTGPDPQPCFGTAEDAFLARVQEGSGVILVTGGSSFLTNELLGKGSNAEFLMGLLGGRSHLLVLPSRPPTDAVGGGTLNPGEAGAAASGGLWGTFPGWLQTTIWQVIIAGCFFALVRGRRLGMPPLEAPLVEIPASELVLATGALYQRARDSRHAGAVTRRWWIRRMQRRFGIPGEGTVPVEQIASAAGDLPPRTIRTLVEAPDPADDARLLELGKSLENLTLTIEQGVRR